jgi:hypothetical protein
LFDAVVLPDEPEPLLAPPAASTTPAEAEVLLLPLWPVADPEPVVAAAVPLLLTVVVLLVEVPALLVPPVVEPPVVVLPLPVLVTVVCEVVPVALALPDEPLPLALVVVDVVLPLEAVVPAANAWPVTSRAMTAADVPARAAARRTFRELSRLMADSEPVDEFFLATDNLLTFSGGRCMSAVS